MYSIPKTPTIPTSFLPKGTLIKFREQHISFRECLIIGSKRINSFSLPGVGLGENLWSCVDQWDVKGSLLRATQIHFPYWKAKKVQEEKVPPFLPVVKAPDSCNWGSCCLFPLNDEHLVGNPPLQGCQIGRTERTWAQQHRWVASALWALAQLFPNCLSNLERSLYFKPGFSVTCRQKRVCNVYTVLKINWEKLLSR